MTVAWVIGSSGLLGSALSRVLHRTGVTVFTPPERFRWGSESELFEQLTSAVKAFSASVGGGNWELYWAAGIGNMGSSESELAVETRTLARLLDLVESEAILFSGRGSLAFASSAGAIYAGSTDDVITEDTPPAPTTAYAREKLKQEELVRKFASPTRQVSALVARISTLYGPGQATGKQQGLLAHMARRILRNQPIQIYVPFDTIRDYITSDDAAAEIVVALHAINKETGAFTKIIASEQPATIAEIISIYKRVARRAPRVVTSASKLTSVYSRRIQFRSKVIPVNKNVRKTSLLVGISQVMATERTALMLSQLKP